MKIHRNSPLVLMAVLLSVTLSGCQSAFGPSALRQTHPAYNQAIVTSVNNELLENIIRLRYRDAPFFLVISSITSSVNVNANASLGAYIPLQGSGDSLSPSLGLSYSDSPTLSYQPLQGADLLKNVYSALQPEALFVLMESGWRADRVLGLCIERINHAFNAPTASGPTPENEPNYKRFIRFLDVLQLLHEDNMIVFGRRQAEGGSGSEEIVLKLLTDGTENLRLINEFYELLALDRSLSEFTISTNILELKPYNNTSLFIQTRSVFGLLNYLSQSVNPPNSHKSAALVTVTMMSDGRREFDWTDTPAGRLFQVWHSKVRPHASYISTRYRDHWFSIDDDDLNTKSTFMLMRQLFDLQSGQTQGYSPTLTLPVR